MDYFHKGPPARLVEGKSPFAHRFGGTPQHRLAGPLAKGLNLHCLYLLNNKDPVIPKVLKKRKWLPLYYPLFNHASEFGYQVVSEEDVQIHFVGRPAGKDFPYPNFPATLPQRQIKAVPLTYGQRKALLYSIVMQRYPKDGSLSKADEQLLKRLDYPFSQIGGIQRMTQGEPESICRNPKCERGYFGNLKVFAVVWNNPIKNFTVWGEGADDSQLIFQFCGDCGTIRVTNRCG